MTMQSQCQPWTIELHADTEEGAHGTQLCMSFTPMGITPLTQLTHLLVQQEQQAVCEHRLPLQQQRKLGLVATELQSISRPHLSHPPRLKPLPGALRSPLQVSSLVNIGRICGVLGK